MRVKVEEGFGNGITTLACSLMTRVVGTFHGDRGLEGWVWEFEPMSCQKKVGKGSLTEW